MNRAKKFSLDYARLSEDESLVLLCLPYWFQNALLDLTERLLWSKVWQTDTGDYPQLTEIDKERIEHAIYLLSVEECDMVINVTTGANSQTVECSGGCGDGGANCTTPPPWQNVPMPGGTPCYPVPPVNPPVNPVPPVPPPGTPEDEWDVYRCKLANYAWEQIRAWLVAVSGVPNTLITIGAILTILWTLAPLALLSIIGVAVLELATLIWAWYALSEGIDEIAEYAVQWWDDHQQEIVCAFYDMTDPSITRTAIVNEFLNDLAIWAEGRPWWIDSLANNLQNLGDAMLPLQIFLAPWELVPPTGYVGAINCTACGEPSTPEGLPEPPLEYFWVPAPVASVTFTPNNNTAVGHTDGYGIFTHAPASPLNYHEVMANVDISDVVQSIVDGIDAHGVAIRVQQYSAITQYSNDGIRLSSNTGGALDLLAVTHLSDWYFHYQNDNVDISSLVEEFALSSDYGNGVMNDAKASFRTQTYGSVSPASMVVDIFYLVSAHA